VCHLLSSVHCPLSPVGYPLSVAHYPLSPVRCPLGLIVFSWSNRDSPPYNEHYDDDDESYSDHYTGGSDSDGPRSEHRLFCHSLSSSLSGTPWCCCGGSRCSCSCKLKHTTGFVSAEWSVLFYFIMYVDSKRVIAQPQYIPSC